MIKNICKGVLCSVIGTLLFILAFALIVQLASISNAVIKPVLQCVKVICIFIGVAIALRGCQRHNWLYGGLVGILYMVFTFLIFSLMDGHFVVGWEALSDLLFQTLTGVISALLLRLRNKDVATV